MSVQQVERLPQERLQELEKLAQLIRYDILVSSTAAGSGHPTSSLSATELMTGLLFGGILRYNLDDPQHPNNETSRRKAACAGFELKSILLQRLGSEGG